jgi:hypothetical protein
MENLQNIKGLKEFGELLLAVLEERQELQMQIEILQKEREIERENLIKEIDKAQKNLMENLVVENVEKAVENERYELAHFFQSEFSDRVSFGSVADDISSNVHFEMDTYGGKAEISCEVAESEVESGFNALVEEAILSMCKDYDFIIIKKER